MDRFSILLNRRDLVIGTWSQLGDPEIVDILGTSGFEFTIVDTEHGHFGLETAENLVRACDAAGLAAIIRVPANEGYMITKALDIGASAVVVPKVSSPDEAERAVRAARYGPEGTRGACPSIRAGGHHVREWRRFAEQEDSPRVIALVETPEAINEIEAISSVPGLLGILFGPFDLSVSLGLDGDTTHRRVEDAAKRVVETAARSKLPVVMPLFESDARNCRHKMEYWQQLGVRAFTIGTDKLLLADHCQRYVAALR